MVEQSDEFKRTVHPRLDLLGWQSEVAWPEGHLRSDPLGEDLVVGILVDVADQSSQLSDAGGAGVGAEHAHRAGRRPEEPVEVLGEGRLAGPVRADQRHELALLDPQGNPVENLRCVRRVAEPDVLDLDGWRHKATVTHGAA